MKKMNKGIGWKEDERRGVKKNGRFLSKNKNSGVRDKRIM